MAIVDTFNVNATSVEFAWPAELTGLERIMLTARGELQRLLSAFFSWTINIKTIYEHTSPYKRAASPEEPISQRREVHLLCGGKVACVATSDVTITTPLVERLFLDEKYAIGQMFRKMESPPQFGLLDCGVKVEDGKDSLWRRYTLSTEGFVCSITEVFPEREMFKLCEQWLDDSRVNGAQAEAENSKHWYAGKTVLIQV